MKIAKKLKSSKRLKSIIEVKTEKQFATLRFNNFIMKFSTIETKEIVKQLSLSLEIQKDRKTKELIEMNLK